MIKEKILITGGAGFIGSHLCERLLQEGYSIVCIDNFNDYYSPIQKKENIKSLLRNPSFKIYKEDILNKEKIEEIFQAEKPKKVVHLAAQAGVRFSFENPSLCRKVNIDGTKNILESSSKNNIENFIFASSSSVYGTNEKIPFSEEDEIKNLVSPYAKTKKEGESMCKKYSQKNGLKIICLRFFTVYGPRGRPDMAPFKFVDSIYNGIPLKIFIDEDSFNKNKMSRDFTFVDDIIEGIISSLKKDNPFEIINLGRGSPVSLNNFIFTIENLIGKKSKKIFLGRQKGDVPVTYADISKAKIILNYSPKFSIEKGMEKFIKWYLSNLNK